MPKEHTTTEILHTVDEFEVVNPLGSKKGKHKLTAVYFKIGNLDSKYLSELQNTYLSTLVQHKFIQSGFTDYDEVLQPLISDVEILETDGVSLKCGGEEKIFHGTIATVSADNLSAHAVAGLTKTFSSGRICMFCNATKQDISEKFTEAEFVMRTSANYRYQLTAVEENPGNAAIYGIKNACCFSKLKYVPSPIVYLFPPDIMHDLLEGIIPAILLLLLKQLVREKQITLVQLNYEIKHFPYGMNDRASKPPPIPEHALRPSGHLPGTASEKWTLFRLLPQMIGNQIHGCSAWDVYLLLREISDIIMAPTIRKCWLPYLEEKITVFLALVEEVFPGKHTPKMHYLMHYPRLLSAYGPLIHVSCLRFEAKHQYFKTIARASRNFKNIAKTLARRHQMRQCWEQTDTTSLGKKVMLTADTRDVPLEAHPGSLTRALQCKLGENVTPIHVIKTKSITVDNVAYKMGSCLVIGMAHAEDIPVFMKIYHIFGVMGTWYLCGKILRPSSFNSHLHSYIAEEEPHWTAVMPGEELAFHGLDSYLNSDGRLTVSLRHWI